MITRIPSGLLFPRIQSQQTSLSSALQRATDGLSSGLRVGVDRDEPTDVAIRSALQRDIRLVTAAITNVSNGVSTVALADAGLAQISSLLEKMSELAETVVNNSLTSAQRTALQTEFTQLGSQIQTISQQTSFNGINLLSGSANVILQVGIGGDANSSISVSGVQATLQAIGLGNATSGQLIYSINANSNDVAVRNAAQTAMAAVQAAIDQVNNSRTTIQASESRLEGSIKSLSVARENIEAAVNQIDDVDATSAQLRASINREATSALLAQANMEPLNVSRLIDTPDEVDSPKSEVRPSSSVELFSGSTLQRESTQLQTIKEGLAKTKKDS
jgi:flagellin